MKNILVMIKKQLLDTFKNKTILIQFVMFPVLTLVMENAINIADMPEHFFIKLFSVMYIGMAPITSVSAIISEEKEKNTLRVLMMADVRPREYLTGVGIYVWSICMIGALVMSTGLEREDVPFYLCIMALGFVISILMGACIGIISKGQMNATGIVIPVMMIFSFAPMLAMFNDKIEKAARFLYTWQIKQVLDNMSFKTPGHGMLFMAANAVILLVIFATIHGKKGLE